MRVRVIPGSAVEGSARVPGDKSIAHRWLIFAATATGSSRLVGLPASLDVRATAACLAALAPKARPALDVWARKDTSVVEGGGSTWNAADPPVADPTLEVEGEGRDRLTRPIEPLRCANSGTTMRLLAGLLAAAPFETTLMGDESLSMRPMERVAEPLRRMGARVDTTQGHAPVTVFGGALQGIHFEQPVASAQVKGAVLLAGLAAEGPTTVVEPAPTRDHTERAIEALGGTVRRDGPAITVEPFQHDGFSARVPGDPSSAVFLIAAAALTGGEITLVDVGLNPSRLHALDVMRAMGIELDRSVERSEAGEPVGTIHAKAGADGIVPVTIDAATLPLVIDEVPILALLAAHAPGPSTFAGAGELRLKESDRLRTIAAGVRSLGGIAEDEEDRLVIGGGGLEGGQADAASDHRMAMAFTVGALAARGTAVIDGIDAAAVSFPGFVPTLSSLGATLEGA